MVVTRGPSLWRVPGTDGLVLAVAPAVGSPSVSPVVQFRFPKACFIQGILVLPRPTAGASLATILARMASASVRITDEHQDPIITDTRGTLQGSNAAQSAAPLLALHGRGFAPFAVQREIKAHRQWGLSFQNVDTANAIELAGVFLYLSGPA